MDKLKNLRPVLLLFLLGFVGVLSILPLIPKLLALQPEKPPIPLELIQAIAVAQSTILVLIMVWVGAVFAGKVGLTSPVIFAIGGPENIFKKFGTQIIPAILGGVVGGIFLVMFFNAASAYLPPEFINAGDALSPPWDTKILYGGITEEILIRWGLMSFIVWMFYRITQRKNTKVKAHNYVLGIVVSSLIFGASHLPIAFTITTEVTAYLITYIIIGNTAFGLIAGYLFWKRGLECAMVAHMLAHITMIAGNGIF